MFDTDPAAFRAHSAGHLVSKVARLFAAALSDDLRSLGLAPAQLMTLLELWSTDGLTQGELVARLDVEQATMAGTLARMERDGLVERRPHPHDGRAQSIHLTERARALRAPAIAVARALNTAALGPLAPDERTQLLHTLPLMADALRAHRRARGGGAAP